MFTFDIQAFGNNDTLTSDNAFYFAYERIPDGTLQKYKVPNPKEGLTESEVKDVMDIAAQKAFRNSKEGDVPNNLSVGGDATAYYELTETFDMDLSF